MEDISLAHVWAAGFFDGEGCITICKRGISGTHTIRLQVAQVVRTPIDKFVELFGGRVYCYSANTPAGRRPYFTWVTEARKAEVVLKVLQPYLVGKAEEAQLALDFMASMPRWGNMHSRPTEEERARRDGYRIALIAMHGWQGKGQATKEKSAEEIEEKREWQRQYSRKYGAEHTDHRREQRQKRKEAANAAD